MDANDFADLPPPRGDDEYPLKEATHVLIGCQMLNYLRITKLPVGLILNFKHARLEWERIVLSKQK
jgi:hypothetical protein